MSEEKVTVTTTGLSAAIMSLRMAGCTEVDISLVPNAVKAEGKKEGGTHTLHIWSIEAEATAADAGKGERVLTPEECGYLDVGKCPLCEDHGQLYKGARGGLALNVYCDAGHLFWVAPYPFEPEYLGKKTEKVMPEEIQATQEALEAVEEVPSEASSTE